MIVGSTGIKINDGHKKNFSFKAESGICRAIKRKSTWHLTTPGHGTECSVNKLQTLTINKCSLYTQTEFYI